MIQQLPMERVSSISNGKGWAKVGAPGLECFLFLLIELGSLKDLKNSKVQVHIFFVFVGLIGTQISRIQ